MSQIIFNQLLCVNKPDGTTILVLFPAVERGKGGTPLSQMIFGCLDPNSVPLAAVSPPYEPHDADDHVADIGAIVQQFLRITRGGGTIILVKPSADEGEKGAAS